MATTQNDWQAWITPDLWFADDPAEARVRHYGVPVWALVGYFNRVHQNVALVSRDYELPESAVRAALAYYELHRQAIDYRINQNVSATKKQEEGDA